MLYFHQKKIQHPDFVITMAIYNNDVLQNAGKYITYCVHADYYKMRILLLYTMHNGVKIYYFLSVYYIMQCYYIMC